MTAFVEVMESGKSKGRAVAAAKFVVTGAAVDAVVVPAERGDGEATGGCGDGGTGDFAAFGHEISEVGHKLALGNAFPKHVISYTNHIQ